eukprot:12319663-Alexandrium_andersonii.AAC.1
MVQGLDEAEAQLGLELARDASLARCARHSRPKGVLHGSGAGRKGRGAGAFRTAPRLWWTCRARTVHP